MIARQADPRWVQGFLGHSKLTTNERYLHAKARPQDVDLLNRAFARGLELVGSYDQRTPARKHPVSKLPSGTFEKWDRAVNEHPLPNTDPNRSVLAGAGGRPATRAELIEFARANDARIARERADR